MSHSIAVAQNTKAALPADSASTVHAPRLTVLDMFRGYAMVVMAMEHSNLFASDTTVAHGTGMVYPVLPHWSHVILGLIGNMATGIFFTLAGLSVAFFERSRRKRGWSEAQITRFLLIRALILVIFELTVNTLSWREPPVFGALCAIAVGLIVLAFLRHVPLWITAALGIGLFFGYPLLMNMLPTYNGDFFSWVSTILVHHHRGSSPQVEINALGRLSLPLLGYVCGRLIQDGKLTVSMRLLWVAAATYVLWFVLRLIGGYGNFLPYRPDLPLIYFLVENKQPPSPVFLLWNIAGAIVILVILHRLQKVIETNFIGQTLILFGQTSLFFYMLHLPLYSLVISQIIPATFLYPLNIGRALLEWIIGLAILIPVCHWYRNLRHKHPDSVLQYL